jgi:DNA repair protein RecN (Recombination protein N)
VQQAKSALASARAEQDAAERDREWLEHAVAELQALAPEVGEEEGLASLRATMQTGQRLSSELATISEQLEGSDGALALLRQAARRLDRMASEHELLAEALAAVDRAVIEASDAEDKLARAVDELAFEPARLDEAETRLFEIRAAARKHRVSADELPALLDDLSARLDALQSGGGRLASLQAELASAQTSYDAAAGALSGLRAQAAERLDKAVAAELRPLKLDAARFRTVVTLLEEGGESGRDRVEFEISTNPGAPFAPLVRIASGGELSRFILALKVALATSGGATTMIFDEIDRGVGGAVASAIGERLHRLAESAQLLVVTHSPQVAARGNRHLLIEKSHQGLVTRTSVHALDESRRREEIARMLSGAQVTDEARAQATRLLEAA